ncbi:maleylpyruvate isomerase family mycothiol-dependent enzyme [Kitasatospora sp. NPDC088346]|uniref:maleylpyruvate isomerase family mycothiol-dependent enzyme n=1 Tax=Kitasatospora sp. NPDC088346 TaxID=3364073 RepID=UPI00381B6CE1
MEISEHLDALRREGALLADTADRTDLDAPVVTCPEWRLRDLVRHTGQVHRWAAAHVREGLAHPLDDAGSQAAWGPDPDDRDLVGWFRDGHASLVAALEKAPADLACWSFLPAPSPLAFWARRQAHETAVHRVDAESATRSTAGSFEPTPTDPAFAEDGIAELLTGFVTRPYGRLRSERPRTLLVRPTDRPAAWLVTVSQDPVVVTEGEGPADCTVDGRAHDLYLMLWNRLPADRVRATGDLAVLDLWQDGSSVRWS